MIRELDSVVLTVDLPEHSLKKGDVGTVVLGHGAVVAVSPGLQHHAVML